MVLETLLSVPGTESAQTRAATPNGGAKAPSAMTALPDELTGRWSFDLVLPLSLDLHWFREIIPGQFRGASAIRLNGAGKIAVAVTLNGTLRFDTAKDITGSTRVRVFAPAPPAVSVCAGPAPPPQVAQTGADPVLDGLLSIHLIDWIRDALRHVGSVRWKQVADRAGVPYTVMLRLFEQWRRLTSAQEAAVLGLIPSDDAFRTVHGISRCVETEDFCPRELTRILHQYLRNDPSFAFSPAATWLRAAGCQPLGFEQTSSSLAALRSAAVPLRRIVEDKEVMTLLTRLPELAAQDLSDDSAECWARTRYRSYSTLENDDEIVDAFSLLTRRVYEAAPAALELALPGHWSELLASAASRIPLIDASIPSGPERESMLKCLSAGDLRPLLGSSGNGATRYGLLTHEFAAAPSIPLRLPYLLRGELRNVYRFVRTAQTSATADGCIEVQLERSVIGQTRSGRICPAAAILRSAFSLRDGTPRDDLDTVRFCDRRSFNAGPTPILWRQALAAVGIKAPAALPCPATVKLTVSLPPDSLVGWTETPHSRDPEFLAVFARISRALQGATRTWFPLMYFQDSENFRPVSHALCLLAYQHTPPYALRRRGEFGYDALDSDSVRHALESADRPLGPAVSAVRRRLIAEGDSRTAELFEPTKNSTLLEMVWERRRPFVALLAADNRFLEEILQFGECCREVRAMTAHNPHMAMRKMSKFVTGFVRSFECRLESFYNGFDFSSLSPLLFIEATRALHPGVRSPVPARLEITNLDGTRIWANAE